MGWTITFWVLAATLGAVYAGYPLLLFLLTWRARVREAPASPTDSEGKELLPTVTVMVPAYNEETVIEEKVRNLLDLDYPLDRLQALIISDGSTDRTCAVVRECLEGEPEETRARIRILERTVRTGKSVALSEAVAETRSQLLVFTDANALYRPDALRRLVGPFSDASVGLVCGRLHYVDPPEGSVDAEGLYWRYEDSIKRSEGLLGRLLVANGSIYAIRSELFEPLPGAVADDFVVPLVVASQGYRLLYEPRAVASEKLPATALEDFRSKARIVTRGLEAFLRYRSRILHSGPTRLAQYMLHKLLRWLAPILLLGLFLSSAQAREVPLIAAALGVQGVLYTLAFLGAVFGGTNTPLLLRMPFHFCLVNAAALKGLLDFARREERSVWEKAASTR